MNKQVKVVEKHQQRRIRACALCIYFQNAGNTDGYCLIHKRPLPKYSECELFRSRDKVPDDDQ